MAKTEAKQVDAHLHVVALLVTAVVDIYMYILHDNDIMEPVASTEQIEVCLSALCA